jgi:hypothetical protein
MRLRGGLDRLEGERKPLKKAKRLYLAYFAPKQYPKPYIDAIPNVITCF